MSKISIYSFFSCSGFLDLGFELLDGEPYTIRMANEINADFRKCYQYARENLKKPIHVADDFIFDNSIEDFILRDDKRKKTEVYQRFDRLLSEDRSKKKIIGFIGGPPCPDFSVAGRNLGKDGKVGPLSDRYIELILQEKPDFFLFENVKGLYSSAKHREYFDQISEKLKVDYFIDPQIVNALWYKVPQHRERLIMIGVKKSLFPKMEKEDFHTELNWDAMQPFKNRINTRKWKIEKADRDVSDGSWPKKFTTDSDIYIRELTVRWCWENQKVELHPNHINQTKPREKTFEKFKGIVEGKTSGKSYHRLCRFKYAPTAAYGNNEVPLHPQETRRISVAEALATQSLPPDFSFPIDMGISALFKAVGNGVPFLMAQGLARTIYQFLDKHIPERLK